MSLSNTLHLLQIRSIFFIYPPFSSNTLHSLKMLSFSSNALPFHQIPFIFFKYPPFSLNTIAPFSSNIILSLQIPSIFFKYPLFSLNKPPFSPNILLSLQISSIFFKYPLFSSNKPPFSSNIRLSLQTPQILNKNPPLTILKNIFWYWKFFPVWIKVWITPPFSSLKIYCVYDYLSIYLSFSFMTVWSPVTHHRA